MAYNEQLADRVRERFMDLNNIEEKAMMGGVTFLYNDKMCVGVLKDELMCRIDPELMETVVEMTGCRQMDFSGKPMKSFILVDSTGMRTQKEFEYWINLALEFNPRAKSAKKAKKKK